MKKILIIGSVSILVSALVTAYWVSHKTAAKTGASAKHSPAAQVSRVSLKIPGPPATADQDKAIGEIRRELQSVIELNQKINSVQSAKSAQLLRIQEQAQIHEKILAEIQKNATRKQEVPSKEALIAQEKLRIIREETLKNKKLLEDNTAVTPAKPS